MPKCRKIREAWASGDRIGALRIAARFFDRSADTQIFKRGMDAHKHPAFYRQLRQDPDQITAVALRLLAIKFGLQPTVAAELHIKGATDGDNDPNHEIVAVGPLELRHVLEIHPVDSGNGGGYLRRVLSLRFQAGAIAVFIRWRVAAERRAGLYPSLGLGGCRFLFGEFGWRRRPSYGVSVAAGGLATPR